MISSLVVAVAENRVIGRNNQLPWRIPEDLKFFKRATMGKPIIMGRRTYESIGKPLPGRTNIVVTRSADYEAEGVKVVNSLTKAMMLSKEVGEEQWVGEVAIIGGAEIFRESLDFADRIYLTEVHAEVEGDVYFPEYDKSAWEEVSRQDFKAEGDNPYDYSFVVLQRPGADIGEPVL